MNILDGFFLLIFVSILLFSLIILATVYWGWHE